MSSANEPYKSRLFNFLNRQKIRFQDRAGVALRNLRSTTELGTQILLYPFYLMVQTGRATRRQLESKVQSSLFLSESKTSQSELDNSNSEFRILNSELDNVLNSTQQEVLQPYLAQRHKKPNRLVTATQKVLASLPQISKRNSVKSFPVKAVWQMLDWLQTSPVAKKVNLFGESKLVPSAPVLPSNTNISSLPNLLVSLDNKVADLKTKSFLSTSRVGKYLSDRSPSANIQTNSTQSSPELPANPVQIRAIINAAIEHFFGTNSSEVNKQIKENSQFNLPNAAQSIPLESKTASTYLPLEDRQKSGLSWSNIFSNTITSTVKSRSSELKKNSTQTNLTESSPELTSNPFQIRVIIKAAIEHFLGTDTSKAGRKIQGSSDLSTLPNSASNIPLESKTASSYLPGSSLDLNLPEAKEQESWLSWNDIFSNTVSSTVQPENNTPTQQSSQPISFSSDKTEDFTSITNFSSPDTELETASDLLETKATTVGYEKHPLEKALEILDGILVWLEGTLLKIWQRFK